MPAEDLPQWTDKFLDALQAVGTPSLLVGGLALLAHSEGRNTQDIALIMALPAVERIAGLEIIERNEWFAEARFGPLRVDLLFTANPLFALVAERHSRDHEFRRRRLKVATVEGLLLLKLFALPSLYRQGQPARAALYESDLALLLLAEDVPDGRLLSTLAPHMLASDVNALSDVLRDVRSRLARKF